MEVVDCGQPLRANPTDIADASGFWRGPKRGSCGTTWNVERRLGPVSWDATRLSGCGSPTTAASPDRETGRRPPADRGPRRTALSSMEPRRRTPGGSNRRRASDLRGTDGGSPGSSGGTIERFGNFTRRRADWKWLGRPPVRCMVSLMALPASAKLLRAARGCVSHRVDGLLPPSPEMRSRSRCLGRCPAQETAFTFGRLRRRR